MPVQAGLIVVRADSAYSAAFAGAVRATGAFFSVTAPDEPARRRGDRGHQPGRLDAHPLPPGGLDDQLGCWVSDAEVAETSHIAFPAWRYHAVLRACLSSVLPRRNELEAWYTR